MSYLSMPAALAAQERVADRFSSLLRTTSDGTRKVPHLTWTVGETGAHVLGGLRLYPEMLARTSKGWENLSVGESENSRILADIPEREPHQIADAIDIAAARFREAFADYSEDLATWHAGLRIPPPAMVGLLVGDVLVHGWDIATALGHKWVIEPADACLAFSAAAPLIPYFVDEDAARGFSATYGMKLRGGPVFTFTFADGSLTTVEGRPPHADCRMSVEPAAYLLTAYGRIPVWRPAIRGRLASYGRRPWLGLKLTSLVRNP